MTAHRDLKNIIRERGKRAGESYTVRDHVMRERAERLGLAAEGSKTAEAAPRVEAVVLKVNRQSARVQIPGEEAR